MDFAVKNSYFFIYLYLSPCSCTNKYVPQPNHGNSPRRERKKGNYITSTYNITLPCQSFLYIRHTTILYIKHTTILYIRHTTTLYIRHSTTLHIRHTTILHIRTPLLCILGILECIFQFRYSITQLSFLP